MNSFVQMNERIKEKTFTAVTCNFCAKFRKVCCSGVWLYPYFTVVIESFSFVLFSYRSTCAFSRASLSFLNSLRVHTDASAAALVCRTFRFVKLLAEATEGRREVCTLRTLEFLVEDSGILQSPECMGRNQAKACRFSSPSVALAPASCGCWQNLSSTFRLSMMAAYKIEHEDGITLLPPVSATRKGKLVSEVRRGLGLVGHYGLLLRKYGTHLTLLSNDDRLKAKCTYTFRPFSSPAPLDLKEFLNQKLPTVKPSNQSQIPHRLWPLGVLEWVGVDTQIREFVDSQSGNYRLTGESR